MRNQQIITYKTEKTKHSQKQSHTARNKTNQAQCTAGTGTIISKAKVVSAQSSEKHKTETHEDPCLKTNSKH